VLLLSHAATVTRRLHIDVHDNDNDDNDNAWQRGPLWPHRMGPIKSHAAPSSPVVRYKNRPFWTPQEVDETSHGRIGRCELSIQPRVWCRISVKMRWRVAATRTPPHGHLLVSVLTLLVVINGCCVRTIGQHLPTRDELDFQLHRNHPEIFYDTKLLPDGAEVTSYVLKRISSRYSSSSVVTLSLSRSPSSSSLGPFHIGNLFRNSFSK